MLIPHCKIFETKSTHPKVCQYRRISGQTKVINTATFQFQRKLLVLWGNVFWDQIFAIYQDGKSLFCAELLTVVKGEKVTAGMSFCINDDKNLSLFLSVLQNLGFEKSTKKSCDLWMQCWNLSQNIKMVAITHIEPWWIYFFSTASLCDKPKQVWKSG